MFRRIWAYVASITFRSLEGFARYLGTGAASGTLRELPLMQLENSEQLLLGAQKVDESVQAQLTARDLVTQSAAHSSEKV